MALGQLEFNSVGYMLKPLDEGEHVLREQIEPFAPVISDQGQQRQTRIQTYNSSVFGPFTGGFGRDRIPAHLVDEPSEYRRFRNSTLDTRFATGAYLPMLEQDATFSSNVEFGMSSARFKGTLYGLWNAGNSGGGLRGITSASLSGTTWTPTAIVSTGTSPRVQLDLIAHKATMIALFAGAEHFTRRTTDGTTWNTPTTEIATGLLSNDVTANEEIDAGLLASIGGELIAIVWDEQNGVITFYRSTDSGDNWADEAVDIASGDGPKGVAVYPGIDGENKLYVGTAEGVWEVDTAPATWTVQHVMPMAFHVDNCRRMIVHNGALWIPEGVGTDQLAGMRRLSNEGDLRRIVTGLGLNTNDGVETDMRGPWRWFESSGVFLYACLGGDLNDSNFQARILCHNGEGWHSIRESTGSNGEEYSWCALNGATLHYSERNVQTIGLNKNMRYLTGADAHPSSGVSTPREASGLIDLPYVNDGLPTVDGVFLQVRVDADDLSATSSGEYINIDYGVNGGARSTDLGNILSGTLKLAVASGAGVSARNTGVRANLHRDGGTNTDTPEMHTVEVATFKIPDKTERFTFQVDLEATAALEDKDIEAVVTELETARDLKTCANFRYGNMAQTFVHIRELAWNEEIQSSDGGAVAVDAEARRVGIVRVVVEEIIK